MPAPRSRCPAPVPGQTTLIWSNVADLQVGGEYQLSFTVKFDAKVLPVGSKTVDNTGSAYTNSSPRSVPKFNADGTPVPGSFTASGSDTVANTKMSSLQVEKSEPSPEGELLRGVHDHTTVYTITVRNTDVAPTDGRGRHRLHARLSGVPGLR